MKKRVVIGLTGGIGSGKSVAADILSELNAYIIDADVVSKDIMPDAEEQIKRNFPECVENGRINRSKLRESVFADDKKRAKINDITHPMIFKRISDGLKDGINIVVAPLLFESGFNKFCDCTLSIIADKEARLKRVARRDNIKADTVLRIMDSQIDQQQLIALSDYVIYNNSDVNSLKEKVEEWFKSIKERDFS